MFKIDGTAIHYMSNNAVGVAKYTLTYHNVQTDQTYINNMFLLYKITQINTQC